MFYHARVPGDVYNGFLFERWRKEAEKDNPQLLFMTAEDVMKPGADDVNLRLFPDELMIGNLKLPLVYYYNYGHPSDGVTVTIPLALLNQVPASPFDWLVTGMLE